MELNKVYNQDCLIGMQNIADKSIDLILCDLPYGTTQNKWDSIIDLELMWKHYERIIKEDGTIVLTAAQPFTSVLVTSNLKLFKYEWIWKKTDSTNFLNAKHQPLRIHESVLVFYRKARYFPQGLKQFNKFRKDQKAKTTENYGETKALQYFQSYTNYPESVFIFGSANNTIHPTQKPVDLFRYLIRTYTQQGDVVLDNCMGSGTTAIACIMENRNYIGFEMNDKYYQIIQKRIKLETVQLKLIA